MSNGWKLELFKSAEGEDFLNFWDSLHGDDEVFILKDGKAYRQTWEEDANKHGNHAERLEEVNLAEALQKLRQKLDGRHV